ncbi:hypothetical protein HMPREF9442_00854 [Paraprevotella xylaniphila YIT 11841]|uniref:Uncharacterized protein n=1 Tax=Paraprevotella xylaniphila YIT 11841 TaxID=762982 RepID=F3QRQ0_9BACT|nr:hypothetical protein HMPREF9442_00854 [Paraprevotella xylaniphila YIT 11841]
MLGEYTFIYVISRIHFCRVCFSFFLIHAMRRNPVNKQKPCRYAT